MGSSSSKFRKYLHNGDEFAAMQIFQSSSELRKNLDPSWSYGESYHHNTALHYAARHGMKHLLRTFIYDMGGNPNKGNAFEETALHCACYVTHPKSLSAQERRLACVLLIMQWKGNTLANGEPEKIDIFAQDIKKNTALHNAASSGFIKVVEVLINQGASMFTENSDGHTPCDLAVKFNHYNVALFLESKMVFSDNNESFNDSDNEEPEEFYSGLRAQDLQEAKDKLLVETSDMLHIPLFTAEALLRDNEWSREQLIDRWMKDPVECCHHAGVQPPDAVMNSVNSDVSIAQQNKFDFGQEEEMICEICTMPTWKCDAPVCIPCNHKFCQSCWNGYLTVKIQSGDTYGILCPAYECPYLVPLDLIERLITPEMARRYLLFDIKGVSW